MGRSGPSFSPFPFAHLRRLTRRGAALETHVAQWIGVHGARSIESSSIGMLVGGRVEIAVIGAGVARHPDPHAAQCEVRVGGLAFTVLGAAAAVRVVAQRVLGGPVELAAARPLTDAENAMWALMVAAVLEAVGVAGEVWPMEPSGLPFDQGDADSAQARGAPLGGGVEPRRDAIEVRATAPAFGTQTVVIELPSGAPLRVPPVRPIRTVWFDVPVVLARATLTAADVAGLQVRDVITVDAGLALVIGDGTVALAAAPGAVEATVMSGYGAPPMAIADDARLELTVELGSTRLSLRQLAELAVGQVVPLGRPLAGPFELRAGGRRVGRGELVDVEGEIGVRVIALEPDPVQE